MPQSSEIISFNYEMKWTRYINETTSYIYEMKFIRFHIFMKEFIDLLKNEILPALTVRAKLNLITNQISQIVTTLLDQKLL